jgi:hypothetical protein
VTAPPTVSRRAAVGSALVAAATIAAGRSPNAGAADQPTDDDLAFANLGLAMEFLLRDFYEHVAEAKLVSGRVAADFDRGRFSAGEHASALGDLLTGAGQAPAAAEDFAFAWPKDTFARPATAAHGGMTVASALTGLYVKASSSLAIPSYRVLYASMAANVAQQVAVLSRAAGLHSVGVSFAPGYEVETASDIVEGLLG